MPARAPAKRPQRERAAPETVRADAAAALAAAKAAAKPAAAPRVVAKKKGVPAPRRKKVPVVAPSASKKHPTYAQMMLVAMDTAPANTLAARMSVQGVTKVVEANWNVPAGPRHFVWAAIKDGLASGLVERVRPNAQTFVLTAAGRVAARKPPAEKKKKPARKAAPKKKKRAAPKKKRAAPKKAARAGAASKRKPAAKKVARKVLAAKAARKAGAGAGAGAVGGRAAATAALAAAAKGSAKHGAHGLELSRGSGSTTLSVAVPGSKHQFFWQYHDANRGGWCNYDVNASDVVEGVYQGYLKNRGETDVRAVRSGSFSYMVDFMAFKQTNLEHAAHTVRDIRRVRNTAVA